MTINCNTKPHKQKTLYEGITNDDRNSRSPSGRYVYQKSYITPLHNCYT